MPSSGVSSKIWLASIKIASIVVRTDSMAVTVFCARFPRSITASCACAIRTPSRRTTRLRVSRLRIAGTFLDRDTVAVVQCLRATIQAVKLAELPIGDIGTAAHQERAEEQEHGHETLHANTTFRV